MSAFVACGPALLWALSRAPGREGVALPEVHLPNSLLIKCHLPRKPLLAPLAPSWFNVLVGFQTTSPQPDCSPLHPSLLRGVFPGGLRGYRGSEHMSQAGQGTRPLSPRPTSLCLSPSFADGLVGMESFWKGRVCVGREGWLLSQGVSRRPARLPASPPHHHGPSRLVSY